MSRRRVRASQRGKATVWLVVALLIVLISAIAFLEVGKWLVVEDPPQTATAIAVLSGGLPERAIEAAQIYHEARAPEVWLTQPDQPRRALAELGVSADGEEDVSRRILIKYGVPEHAIKILQPTILNTADEMNAIAGALQNAHGAAVIIVTSKPHTRRVHALWNRLEAGRGKIIVRAARTDSFDPAHWWHTTHDALDVVREVLGLVNVWAGLPLKPAK